MTVDGNQVYFQYDSFKAERRPGGVFSSKEKTETKTSKLEDLADYQPLKRLGFLTAFDFVLHHFVSDSSMESN